MNFRTLKFTGFTLAFILFVSVTYGQVLVKGKVVSKDEQSPIPGVSILIKSTSTGTVTDANGEYSIEVMPENTLVFSAVGFKLVEIDVGNQLSIDIEMEEDVKWLDDVIVMAYSEKTKTEISSAVVSLKADEINNVTVNSVEEMLVGKIAGVQVQTASGQPGDGADVRIRGVGSVFSTQRPLVVVDGIKWGSYNPNDIASVTILKDAGATGLYGSEAASGVIIITTKSGTSQKTIINAKISTGYKEATVGNFKVMNGEELYEYHGLVYPDLLFGLARPDSLKNRNYDWIGNSFKRAPVSTYYVSASGGNEKTTYFLSLDHMKDKGTALNSDYQRYSLHSKVKFNVNSKLSITTNINASTSKSKYPHWTYSESPFRLIPWDFPENSDGTLVDDVSDANWISNATNNIFHSDNYNEYGGYGSSGAVNLLIEYKIFNWLKFESRNSFGASYSKYEEIVSPLSFEGSDLGYVTNAVTIDQSIGTTNLLKFQHSFGDHSFDGLAGFEGGKYIVEFDIGGTGSGIFPGQRVLSVTGSGVPTGNIGEEAGISTLSQLNYNYAKKYFLTGSFRRDGSSKFAPNNKYGNFYSFAASWMISNEEFFKSVSFVDYLKLRASYGAVGNSSFPGGYYPYFSSYNFSYSYNNNAAAYPDQIGNNNLSWETSYPMNIGVDLEILNKVEMNVDVYKTLTKDLLFKDPVAYSNAFSFQWMNVGEIENKGIEIAINAIVIDTKDFRWDVNFNVGKNSNKLVKLSAKDVDQITVGSDDILQVLEVDGEAFSWYMPKWLGVDPQTGEPMWEDIIFDASTGAEIGREVTSSYPDADFQPVGNPFPDFTGGFGTLLSYRGFRLSAAFSYVVGNDIYHNTRKQIDNDGANNNINAMVLQDGWSRWEEIGDEATHPEPTLGGNRNAHEHSSRYLEDGTYLRLRNLTFSYSLPSAWVQKAKLSEFVVSFKVDNLVTWTKFSGMDPDVPLYQASYSLPGLSSFKYPISKQFLFGIELSF